MENEQANINLFETKINILPPICIKCNLDYSGFCNVKQNAIDWNEFNCKNNLNELKLQTHIPGSYRNIIHLLKDKKDLFPARKTILCDNSKFTSYYWYTFHKRTKTSRLYSSLYNQCTPMTNKKVTASFLHWFRTRSIKFIYFQTIFNLLK